MHTDMHARASHVCRFLDLRVATYRAGVFFITHTVVCVLLSEALQQVSSFLSDHPGEVVVIRVCCDWAHRHAFSVDSGDSAVRALQAALGAHLFDHSQLADGAMPTVDAMVAAGQQVALFLDLPTSLLPCTHMWGGAALETLWADMPSPQGTITRLVDEMSRDGGGGGGPGGGDQRRMRYAAAAVTPNTASVLQALLANVVLPHVG